MTTPALANLLIVEDDLDIADMLNAYFRVQGYAVRTVNWGEDAVRACISELPDLVILDIRLPDIDGFEVARQLRENRKTQHLPIIFLTEKRERDSRLKGLAFSAEDYITKPFDVQELRLRVRNALERTHRSSLTNAVTGLPEGSMVIERLTQFAQSELQSMLVVTLLNVPQFRDAYGFVAADDLLRAVALMLQDTLRELPAADLFLGQYDAGRFLIIAPTAQAAALKQAVAARLDQSFDLFYHSPDREKSTFGTNRLAVSVTEIQSGSSAGGLERVKYWIEHPGA